MAFLDFNWAEAAPQDPGKCEWIGFSPRYKRIIQAPEGQPAQISAKVSVTPAKMKTQAQMLAFMSLETQKCWGSKGKTCVCSFCSPLKSFLWLFYLVLLLNTRAGAEDSTGHLAASLIQEWLQLSAFDVSIKGNHLPSCWNEHQLEENGICSKMLLHPVCLPVALDAHAPCVSIITRMTQLHYNSQCR